MKIGKLYSILNNKNQFYEVHKSITITQYQLTEIHSHDVFIKNMKDNFLMNGKICTKRKQIY